MIASVISLSVLDESVFYCVGFSGNVLPVGGITVVRKSNNGELSSPLSHILNVILPEPTNIYMKTKQNHQICNTASKNEKSHPPTAKIAARRWLNLYENGELMGSFPFRSQIYGNSSFLGIKIRPKSRSGNSELFLYKNVDFLLKKLLSCGNPQDKVLGIFLIR